MPKTISYRVTDYELSQIEDLKEWLQKTWTEAGINKKVTTSDVIFQALINDWQKKCLPYKNEKENFKPYKFRAEKDIPFT